MSPYHAKGLQALSELQGDQIVHLRAKFDAETRDHDWIKALAGEGDWIIVSGDTRISRGVAERVAWHESKLTAFFFGEPFPEDGYWKQAAALVAWWPLIQKQARSTPSGHGFLLPKKGKEFRRIYP
jgi:PIN like domain